MDRIISTRDHLIRFISAHVVYLHVRRAILEGNVENLGSFLHDRWIVKIVTPLGLTKYISVVVVKDRYRLFMISEPDWKLWKGDKSENKLYQGDHPDKYAELRELKLKEIEDATTKG